MKNIDAYIEQSKTMDGGNHQTKSYPFINEGLILVKKPEPDFLEMQKRIKKCNELNVNIPMYIDYKYDGKNYWILEELAPGKEMQHLILNENINEVYGNIPYEHFEKYIKDVYLLENHGLGCEPKARNVFYDKEKGFTIIDVRLLSKIEEQNSLEEVNDFFKIFYPLLINVVINHKADQKVIEKTTASVLKAFENGHPYFKKYKRWIYRSENYFTNFVEKLGYDLTLNNEEHKQLINLIDSLIDNEVEKTINNSHSYYNSSYIELLNNSLKRCPQFDLSNLKGKNLEEHIKITVRDKVKSICLDNLENPDLIKIYYNIRKKELDPIRMYKEEYTIGLIDEEIKNINMSKNKKK